MARVQGGRSQGGVGKDWSADPIWPYHEWQLATITKEDGSERLGCRVVTSTAIAASIHKMFDSNKIPSILVDDGVDDKGDVGYVYIDAIHRVRAEYLVRIKIKQQLTPLPPELIDLLNLAKTANTTPKTPPVISKTSEVVSKVVPKSAAVPRTNSTIDALGARKSTADTSARSLPSKPAAIKAHLNAKNSGEKISTPSIKSVEPSLAPKRAESANKVDPLPPSKLRDAKQSESEEKEDVEPPSSDVPRELWGRLKGYQRDGVLKFIRLSGRMYLADDPGLGKTVQAIVCATFYRQRWPVLIVCPSTVKVNWCQEFCKWLGGTGFERRDVRIISSEADACKILPDPSDADLAAAASATARAAPAGKPVKRKRPAPAPSKVAKKNPPRDVVSDADVVRRKEAAEKRRIKKAEDEKKAALEPKPIHQIYIISYDLLIRPKVFSRVSARRFKVVISDESHFLRNPSAQRTISFIGLALKAPHVLELSGTPGYCPEQIYSQMRALQPNLFPPFWVPPPPHINTQARWRAAEASLPCTFAGRWCDPQPEPTFAGKFTWALNGCSRLGELNAILKEFCLLKRCKVDVLKELPEKLRHPIHFEVPANERQVIETELAAIKGLRKTKPREFKQRFMKLFNDLPRIKTPAVQEYLTSLMTGAGELAIDPTRKVLIFAHHKVMVTVIEDVVKKHKYGYMKITGATPPTKRQQFVDQFQTDPETRVAILSMTAAGFGLNLQAASLVIFAELLFSPSCMIQCEDRSHRLGQTAPAVICRYMIARATLDEGLLRMVQRKTTTSAEMIEGKRDTFAMKRAQRLALSTDEPENAEDEEREITEEQLEEAAWAEQDPLQDDAAWQDIANNFSSS